MWATSSYFWLFSAKHTVTPRSLTKTSRSCFVYLLSSLDVPKMMTCVSLSEVFTFMIAGMANANVLPLPINDWNMKLESLPSKIWRIAKAWMIEGLEYIKGIDLRLLISFEGNLMSSHSLCVPRTFCRILDLSILQVFGWAKLESCPA